MKEIKRAKEELDKISQDKKERRLAELREKAIMDEMAIRDSGYNDGFAEGKKDGLEEGIKEGELRGRNAQLVEQIKKKLDRGKSIPQIAEELEETEDRIQELMREYFQTGK